MENDVATSDPRKWYNGYAFPLIPVIRTRNADEYNTASFSFHWLFIQLWTRDSFDFELAFTISEHWGIGLTAMVPYLRLAFCIPCPRFIQMWAYTNLWRKPPKQPKEAISATITPNGVQDKGPMDYSAENKGK